MIKPNTSNPAVIGWVEEMAGLCQPDRVFWCDGSEAEKASLLEEALTQGILLRLNQKKLPGCYYHRSTADDVARSEDRTLICTPTPEEAGPANNRAFAPAGCVDGRFT
jgi:phosphoenolpyruvate carboxykinase (GTP)